MTICQSQRRPCRVSVREEDADCLLRIARVILSRPGKLVVADGGIDAADLARVKIALDFASRPGLMLRAFVEGWDHVRIVREVY